MHFHVKRKYKQVAKDIFIYETFNLVVTFAPTFVISIILIAFPGLLITNQRFDTTWDYILIYVTVWQTWSGFPDIRTQIRMLIDDGKKHEF